MEIKVRKCFSCQATRECMDCTGTGVILLKKDEVQYNCDINSRYLWIVRR